MSETLADSKLKENLEALGYTYKDLIETAAGDPSYRIFSESIKLLDHCKTQTVIEAHVEIQALTRTSTIHNITILLKRFNPAFPNGEILYGNYWHTLKGLATRQEALIDFEHKINYIESKEQEQLKELFTLQERNLAAGTSRRIK
ncbi:hypothetical protein [Chitinophaga cymbidii]|uniref:Uncharacterized protein n=1 Tax=Chitinophaga cymbidii TaxID=1096750 RepID=A0A512RFR7_9BACT|nr:hypothetical protein [Chitinophaga cymbidii]GEP94535.1 hypothetical protein CCY01nite_07950 [Chitinophaga cymbidii]